MEGYDVGMVCLSGHSVTGMASSAPQFGSPFCPKCGQQTIAKCPECGATIRGHYHVPGFLSTAPWEPSSHCHACGKPYPWTERKAEALQEMIDELDGLSDEEREKLKKSVPDVIADTPKSETAALRFKKAVGKVGKVAGNLMMSVLTKVATETVKQAMGL